MVEKREFVVIFKTEKSSDGSQIFTPLEVVEGKYNYETDWFDSKDDDLQYIHIADVPDHIIGYAYRTIIEYKKESLTEEAIDILKQELLEQAKKYIYGKNPKNGCLIAIDPTNGNQYMFEDMDRDKDDYKSGSERKNETSLIDLQMTPSEIEEEVKKTIKGQDEAVRKITTALWTTLKFRKMKKKNMLIIGPSGVGKTAIFEKIKQILNIPVVIFSVPGLSQAGYVGRSTDEILKQVYYETDENLELAEQAIIILDEIDKIASKGEGGVSTSGVQNELLKIIEGCVRYIETGFPGEPGFEIDTSKMIFIATGAFQELHEKPKTPLGFTSVKEEIEPKKTIINTDKLINYGLKRELVGRLPIIVELNSLGKEELKDIILNSDESELMATINALKELNVEIKNIDEVIDYIVDDAIKKQIGARGLILTLNNLFQEIFYQVGNNPNKYSKVIIGSNIIEDKYDFELVKRRNNTRKRVKQN